MYCCRACDTKKHSAHRAPAVAKVYLDANLLFWKVFFTENWATGGKEKSYWDKEKHANY